MASNSFRDSVNSLGWSRREQPASTSNSSNSVLGGLQRFNPFGNDGLVRLPTHNEGPGAPLPAPTRREEEEGWFARKSTLVSPPSHVVLPSLFPPAFRSVLTAPKMTYFLSISRIMDTKDVGCGCMVFRCTHTLHVSVFGPQPIRPDVS